MKRCIKHALLSLCLLVPTTAAAVVATAAPAVANHDNVEEHWGYQCYEYDNYEGSTYQHWGSATYVTDYYGHFYECYEAGVGYWFYRMYG